MQQNKTVELLAPAGNFESLTAAIHSGANAVYFGVDQLNMRARATMNFTLDDLLSIALQCHAKNVKAYLTLNTIIYDHDLSLIKTIINKAKAAGIDAVIAADHAVIAYAASVRMPIHISTQANVSNIETVKFFAPFADVVVLARELSLKQVETICKEIKRQNICGVSGKPIKIEVFAHGALCMAVSGKCYLSLHSHNASANRGACIQNCRHRYKVTDIEDDVELEIDNEYIMASKDLKTIDFLDQLLLAGVDVLKLEGRGRSPEYVSNVTACYREAIDAVAQNSFGEEKLNQWNERLKEVYNRDFWGGYFLGKEMGEWSNTSGSKATTQKIYLGKGKHYFSKTQIAEFEIETYQLNVGDRILITGPTTGAYESTITSLHVNDDGAKDIAVKGDRCAFPVDRPIRTSDKLYKIVSANT
ncbi:peptidase U32 family protein [Pinibacter aurantiacus]|uniref:U32 family peptidase n=1 Tax=Pinibacter aurantiacus TaxID=2851599 RepID=A0A9E2W3C4_9BACT|nr:peptidase U32 family protein [Pinibacter aurantiacus]MBV4358380.1 U32 family peptidase [Pinibacter aurantiacus]